MLWTLLPVITVATSFCDFSALESSGEHESCPVDVPLSCSSGSSDSCCYEGTNGLFLQTQFWDYNPATGPNDTWTLHGLWSDKCAGGYDQFCNSGWAIHSATTTLKQLGLHELIEKMSKIWKNQGPSDDSLWTHEFNKHGTCMSTVNPSCYTGASSANDNVGDFFKAAVGLYEELPTYDFLAGAGITPSSSKTWTLSEFNDAITNHTGGSSVFLGCDRHNAVNEVWYFFKLRGSVADGTFYNTDAISMSTCSDGFKYLPKMKRGGGGNPGDGNTHRAHLEIDGYKGCLISDGSWYASGTCATFRLASSVGGYSVRSSKGPCGVENGQLKCGNGVSPSDFEVKDGYLSYGGSTEWSANRKPQGQGRETVSNGDGNVSFKIKIST